LIATGTAERIGEGGNDDDDDDDRMEGDDSEIVGDR
jgi:hypothetical protein